MPLRHHRHRRPSLQALPPTTATTTGIFNTFGNTAFENSRINYGDGGIVSVKTNNADLRVLMLNPGERGFNQGIDAKSELGPTWPQMVEDGINTCAG